MNQLLFIGDRNNAGTGFYCNCYIFEIIIWNVKLSTSQRNQAYNYLYDKFHH